MARIHRPIWEHFLKDCEQLAIFDNVLHPESRIMQDILHDPSLWGINLTGFLFWLWSQVKQILGFQEL